jgi:hypothetical protein
MADNVSALPAAMQARRAALEGNAPNDPTPAPAPVAAPAAPAPTPAPAPTEPAPTGSNVTISRDEFNELQASAGKARAAEGRAETLTMDVEALTRRLTELEDASKGITKPAAQPAAVETWEPTPVQFTDKDNEDYGESKPFVIKVVQEVLNTAFPKLAARIDAIEEALGGVKTIAEGASTAARTVRAKTYTDQIRDKVPEFDECTGHKHWHDFTEATDPDTGHTWAELIQSNFDRENVPGMVRVFNKFKEKYGVGKAPAPTGYEGGIPNGGSGSDDDVPTGPKMLPFSKRKEAHKKYINKEISYEEYEVIKSEYDAADREGRVDYNK